MKKKIEMKRNTKVDKYQLDRPNLIQKVAAPP
ncbi:MAG: hypothetical protein RIQ68_696 [Pseudomonadota bacterium]